MLFCYYVFIMFLMSLIIYIFLYLPLPIFNLMANNKTTPSFSMYVTSIVTQTKSVTTQSLSMVV